MQAETAGDGLNSYMASTRTLRACPLLAVGPAGGLVPAIDLQPTRFPVGDHVVHSCCPADEPFLNGPITPIGPAPVWFDAAPAS